MKSFLDPATTFARQPPELGALLARIDTGRGQERLFEDQMPALLKQLFEDARVASITASNAIEGVVVDPERGRHIAEGGPRFRSRNEKEFAGYRDAIDTLIRVDNSEPLNIPFLLRLHRQLFYYANGRGGHLKSDQNMIVSYDSGRREIVFAPPPPEETEFLLQELLTRYAIAQKDGTAHPVVLISALILDLLAIHPVADGNGRLARLVTTHELLAHNYGVVRYISLEQRIFESKNTYYASLYESQQEWHEGTHNIWPWTSYLVRVLGDAYEDFERRMAAADQIRGSKQERVAQYILRQAPREFTRRDIERAFPDISAATIRLVLGELQNANLISSTRRGPGARWNRIQD